MWGKLLTVLVVGSIIGAVTFLGWRTIAAYGEARYAAGLSDEKIRSTEAMRAADQKAATSSMGYLTQQIAAGDKNRDELERLAAIALTSDRSTQAYAQTPDGSSACLPPERVQLLEADRAAYFPSASPAAADGQAAGPLPADPAPDRP